MRRKALALLGLLLLSLTGCVAMAVTAAVAAGVVYVSGEAGKTYTADVDRTHQATLKVLEEMGLPVLEQKRDGDGWRLRSRRSGDADEIKIHITPGDTHTTVVKIRVGVMGDKEYSTRLLLGIEQRL